MTTIFLIRHAEAEGNIYRRAQGQYNSLVTTNGYLQLEALRARFQPEKLHAIYASDLFRTRETAKAIAAPRGMTVRLRRDLREIKMGVWEDRTWGELNHFEPEQMDFFNNHPERWEVSGSESFAQLRARLSAALREIAAAHPGQRVAVVSHGMAIRALLSTLMGLPCADMSQIPHSDNTGVTLLEASGDDIRVVSTGDNSHLDETISTFAQQRWWRDGNTKRDNNLWFRPMDLKRDKAFFTACRREAWSFVHGDCSDYDETGFFTQALEESEQDPRSVFFAMLGDAPAGMLQLSPEEDKELGVGRIPFLYMLPEHRHQNMGIQLLGQATSVYRTLGRERLLLRCAPDNYSAIRFYLKNGFRKISTDPGVRKPLYVLSKTIAVPEP